MSQTKAQLVSGTTAQDLTVDNINTTSVNSGQLSNRNKVINGEAIVSQRGTTIHGATGSFTAIDRFKTRIGSSYDFDVEVSQSTDTPNGFSKSLKISPRATSTPSGGANGAIATLLEGQNLQDFNFGSSSAKPMTLTFYAKSGSAGAGTYSIEITFFNSSGSSFHQTRAFTITTSWQRFTFTFEANGNSTSQAIRNDNLQGLNISWHLASGDDDKASAITTWTTVGAMRTITGMDNFMSSTSNELYLTGVQLEVGSTATDFEHRSFGQELALCQRYYVEMGGGNYGDYAYMTGYMFNNGNSLAFGLYLPCAMRATPTIAVTGNLNVRESGNTVAANSPAIGGYDTNSNWIACSIGMVSDMGSNGDPATLTNTNNAGITLDAEL